MKILFVVDARSPTARNWIRHFAARGDQIFIASTFACSLDFPINRLETIPVAFSGLKKETQRPGGATRTLGLRTFIRQWIGPLTIRRAAQKLRAFIEEVQPDLIHAMRIPYEGMIAASAIGGLGFDTASLVNPADTTADSYAIRSTQKNSRRLFERRLIVSIWGNDFTLHAPASPLMRHYTRRTMQIADAVHADCRRDVRLAKEWEFDSSKPSLVAPGNGGIRTDIFYPPSTSVEEPIILNPRGFRSYVRNDMFFKAIPLVLAKHPNAKFICASMAGEPQAIQWIRELDASTGSARRISDSVELLDLMPHAQTADVYRRAQILVSPSIHDGTPNSLLEGMACGCFPVAGDLESIREWITPNENGLLFDSTDHQSIAAAIIDAIENKNLREKAAGLNREIITTRAEYGKNMRRAERFYEGVYR